MADNPSIVPGENDRKIADAALLFNDDPSKLRKPEAPRSPEVTPSADYDLEEVSFVEAPDSTPVVPPTIPTKVKVTSEPKPEGRARSQVVATASVDQVWSRGAEWGQSLATLAAVAVVAGSVFLWSISEGWNLLAIISVLAGGAAFIVFSYPILISLERPVRITPEQAVKDFFGALSHHVPHYRRMWLLLSTAGRTSEFYSTFPEFKDYWIGRLDKLRAGRSGRFTPLKFEVGDFKADKSVGKTEVDAKYTVKVYVRGRQDEGPIDSFRIETSLVKGSDRMWYLNKGNLPGSRI